MCPSASGEVKGCLRSLAALHFKRDLAYSGVETVSGTLTAGFQSESLRL